MNLRGTERLQALLAEQLDTPRTGEAPPHSYEETTRRMVEKVEDDVRSLRRRLDALLFMVCSAILAEGISRFFGG